MHRILLDWFYISYDLKCREPIELSRVEKKSKISNTRSTLLKKIRLLSSNNLFEYIQSIFYLKILNSRRYIMATTQKLIFKLFKK